MGVHVNLLEEIRNRIATAISSGVLSGVVKAVYIGPRAQARGGTNYPIITIKPTDGGTDPEFHNNGNRDNQNFEITLIDNKLTADTNTLYKTSGATGIVYTFEKLLDTLIENTSQTVDFQMNSKSSDLGSITWRYEYFEDRVEIVINMTKATAFYLYGTASS